MGLPPELMSTPQPTLPPASTPTPNPVTGGLGDLPVNRHGPTLGSGQGMSQRVDQEVGQRIGTTRVSNPTLSQTDDVVNRIHEAERNLKDVRRDQWLEMNRASASNVLASIGSELPSHLAEVSNPAAKALADRLSTPNPAASGPDPALMQRMAEVAVRRVARKRGVTVETPSARIEGENATVTVTYIDDGRVLDDPETLRSAFERAVTTELALKGMDVTVSIDLSRQKDGAVESLGSAEDEDVEMYACDACNGLVKATDPSCPHCGAIFDDGEEEQQPTEQEAPPREPPGGPSRGPPGGPSKGPPGGPSRGPPGGPSKGPPGGPSRGPPGGPSRDHREVRVEDRQGDRARDHQEDRVEDRQVDRARDRREDRVEDRQVDRARDHQEDRVEDRQVDREGPPEVRVEDRQADRARDHREDRVEDHQEVRVEDRQGDRARDHQEDRNADLPDRNDPERIDAKRINSGHVERLPGPPRSRRGP